ncbi:MAG: hypothetical protein HFH41_03470 [Lachnospiraceae bacterium]|nr:hypothetical protein [Lachnospiraceae bacterium]
MNRTGNRTKGKREKINKIRKYLLIETEVEIFACIHATSMIFIYGCLQWMAGKELSFPILAVQMILGYVIAWVQKGLFFGKKHYSDREYRIREVLWCLLPGVLVVAAGRMGHWFSHELWQVSIWFYGIMAAYFIFLWLFLKNVCRKETREMNDLLEQWRQKSKEADERAEGRVKR